MADLIKGTKACEQQEKIVISLHHKNQSSTKG